jgi:hypothetical protein
VILGRNPALFVGLFVAAVNCLVLLGILSWTAEQIAAVDALAVAFIAVLANQATTGSLLGRDTR